MINCNRASVISSLESWRNIRFFALSISAPFPPMTASEYSLYFSWKFISTRAIKMIVAEMLVNMARQDAISYGWLHTKLFAISIRISVVQNTKLWMYNPRIYKKFVKINFQYFLKIQTNCKLEFRDRDCLFWNNSAGNQVLFSQSYSTIHLKRKK